MSTFEKLRKKLARRLESEVAPWSSELAGHLGELARPCLALVPVTRGKAAARFGGPTLLSKGTPWPKSSDGKHLDYLGCLDLAALTAAGGPALEGAWPSRGVVSVFIEDLSGAAAPVVVRCIHTDVGVDALVEQPEPKTRVGHEALMDLRPVSLKAVPSISIPTTLRSVRRLVEAADEPDAEVILSELLWGITPDDAIGHVGGWASSHDGADLHREIALRSIGRAELVYSDYWDSVEDYEASISKHHGAAIEYRRMRPDVLWLIEHAQEIAAEAARWSLFFRLDSNGEMNLQINDADPLFVFAPTDDLRVGRLDRVTGCVLQS